MRRGLRLLVALGALVAAGSAPCAVPADASGIEMVRFEGGRGGSGFHGGGFHGGGFHGGRFHGGGFRGGGFHGGGFHRGFGARGFGFRPGFPGYGGYGGYGLRRRRVWCYYHPGACYPYR